MNQRINDLMAYLDGAHSVFHAVEGLRNILEANGYTVLARTKDYHETERAVIARYDRKDEE